MLLVFSVLCLFLLKLMGVVLLVLGVLWFGLVGSEVFLVNVCVVSISFLVLLGVM